MRFSLNLIASTQPAVITLNYHYPLSAAIYKIIQSADAGFSAFLHNTGYGEGYKSFKLFTFSDINTSFSISGDRMLLRGNQAQLVICFFMPKAAENFIKGLFTNQRIEIADYKSKAIFTVQGVQSIDNTINSGEQNITVALTPLSPMVTGRKNEKGYYDYRSPADPDFIDCLTYNLLEKYRVAYNATDAQLQQLKQTVHISLMPYRQPPKQRVIAIKQGSPGETKIRGYTKFALNITAPPAMVQLALGAGMGLYNSQGMGCVGLV